MNAPSWRRSAPTRPLLLKYGGGVMILRSRRGTSLRSTAGEALILHRFTRSPPMRSTIIVASIVVIAAPAVSAPPTKAEVDKAVAALEADGGSIYYVLVGNEKHLTVSLVGKKVTDATL